VKIIMKITETDFKDLFIIQNRKFEDHRGKLVKYFFSDFFKNLNFIVDDIYTTNSNKNIIRGMHHQVHPYGQTKLISCLSGSFLDIAIDLRIGSRTFGSIFSHVLKHDIGESLVIPAGFSHGTFSLEDGTTMLSICSGKYLPEYEAGIRMKTLALGLDLSEGIESEKDKSLPSLESIIEIHK
jgi:dTDP-4-dehydrorhamnose 3,5-epimerase